MKVKMTSGKEFDIDFQSESGYQQMRDMHVYLQSKGFFSERESDDIEIQKMIDQSLVSAFPTIDRDTMQMVCKHYLNQLNERKKWGEIDDIDLAIQLAKLVVLELEERWS